jgi:hypothetical protein
MAVLYILAGGAAQSLVEKARTGFEAAEGCTIEATFSAVGALPPGCDLTTLYAAAVTSAARSSADAARFVSRLGQPAG